MSEVCHNRIIGNFTVYQNGLETNLLQPFAHPEKFRIEVNIVAAQKQASLVTIFCFLQVSIALNSSTVPLPYRCSGVPSACVRLSTCRSLLGGVGVYIRWSCLFTVANAAVKLILILRFVAINFFACAQKTVARWVCPDQGVHNLSVIAESRLFLWITAASEWKRFFAVLLPHVSLAVFLLSILIQ